MKAEELRIGNYINAWRISDDWEYKKIESGKELDFIFMQEENCIYEPIPLTEEWLLRFGFFVRYKSSLSTVYESKRDNRINVRFKSFNSTANIRFYDELVKKIKYIHEFQNLYFALTGKELKASEEKQGSDNLSECEKT